MIILILIGFKFDVNIDVIILIGSDVDIFIEIIILVSDDNNMLVVEDVGLIVLFVCFFSEIVKKLLEDIMIVNVVDGF